MVVCKFGGSSVADADQVKKVAAILKADPRRSVVVVSAPGKRNKADTKITDLLYACEASVQKGLACDEQFALIAQRFTAIAIDLGLSEGFLNEALAEVCRNINAGFGADYAASRGEYLSALLIAAYLGWTFLDAADLVVINDNGTVAEETYAKVAQAIEPGKQYVFPGFYGLSTEGKVKTFSRGGSDISGSIVARAVGAELYENWTDVSGVFMADPRLIPDAKVIKTMTYREVRELAAVGFSVFHEEAIAPVREAGIPIQVKNTNKPNDEGSSIVSSRNASEDPIVGITGKSGYCRLAVAKLLLFKQPGVRARMEDTLRTLGITPEFSLVGIDSMVWFFPVSQISNGQFSAVANLMVGEFKLDSAQCDSGFAVVAITGEALMGSHRMATALGPTLVDNSIDVQFVNIGASPITCLIGVSEPQLHAALTALYNAIIR